MVSTTTHMNMAKKNIDGLLLQSKIIDCNIRGGGDKNKLLNDNHNHQLQHLKPLI